MFLSRLMILFVAIFAFVLSYNPHNSVLKLVSYAWAGLGAAFGPLILSALYWRRTTKNAAIVGMAVGAATVIIWKNLSYLGGMFQLYEIIPGFLLSTIAIITVSLLSAKPEEKLVTQFMQVLKSLK